MLLFQHTHPRWCFGLLKWVLKDWRILCLLMMICGSSVSVNVEKSNEYVNKGDNSGGSSSKGSISLFEAAKVAYNVTSWGINYTLEYMGYDVCPYVADPVGAVKEALQTRIKAQPLAIETTINAFSAWHFRSGHGIDGPPELALLLARGTEWVSSLHVIIGNETYFTLTSILLCGLSRLQGVITMVQGEALVWAPLIRPLKSMRVLYG
ncbi:unnamed protein product, partial [Choristocarpus tenellus]